MFLILLFLAGCTSQANENELNECEKLTGEGKDTCYYNTSMNAKDSVYCSKIENKDTKDICYYTLVVNYKIENKDLCDLIENQETKDLCYSYAATDTNDAKYCGKMSNGYEKDICYYDIAIATDNENLCNKINDWQWKSDCNTLMYYS